MRQQQQRLIAARAGCAAVAARQDFRLPFRQTVTAVHAPSLPALEAAGCAAVPAR
ncbi:MAG TPA: hypothetical protein VGF45_19680 [Polyangia bacterium]